MTPDDLEELMFWLDPDPDGTGVPDRDRGAEKYEKIRYKIIKIYTNRGTHRAEEIADKTFARVCAKVKKLRLSYDGDPALYFYGVAKKVFQEVIREEDFTISQPFPVDDRDDIELRHAWLEHCLDRLKPESRELILRFYDGEKREKIENRKKLAERLGITSKALSLRALQIRRKLLNCMQGYLAGRRLPEVKPVQGR